MTHDAVAHVPVARDIADQIADRLAAPPQGGNELPEWWPQSLAHGGAGIALLHIERAATGHRPWEFARAWLRCITSRPVSIGSNAALYYGAPAIEFVVHAAAAHHPRAARHLHPLQAATDQVVRRRLDDASRRLAAGGRPPLAEFDCIRGMAGLAAVLLCRRNPPARLTSQVLAHLVAVSEPVTDGDDVLPGWWTDLAPNSTPSPDRFPGGHANTGMAHGIAGVLAVLTLALRRDYTVAGQIQAIERILAWLDRWQQHTRSAAWWPYWITREDLRRGHTDQTAPRRPSWCYGALGLARAQQMAALVLGQPIRQAMVEHAATVALTDPAIVGQTEDASLCHGYAGLIHLAAVLAADSRAPGALTTPIPGLLDKLAIALERREPTDPGWLEGQAGTALALHALATRPATGWDRALLIT